MDCRSFLHQLFVTVLQYSGKSLNHSASKESDFLVSFLNNFKITVVGPMKCQREHSLTNIKKNFLNHQSDFKRA